MIYEEELKKIEIEFNILNKNIQKEYKSTINNKKIIEMFKKRSKLEKIIELYNYYKKNNKEINEINKMFEKNEKMDFEILNMLKDEILKLNKEKKIIINKLKKILFCEDKYYKRNIIMEIRAGAGGNEASLFAKELFFMYQKYIEYKKWKIEILNLNINNIGGYKEIIFLINGNNIYSKLKFENGAHRVQRIPNTESQGRLHTSTVTVVVMPEPKDIEIEILDKDIRIDVFRASGAGGQHVNKTSSAVRITHIPTKIVVVVQDERSQLKNKIKAMKILKARIYNKNIQKEKNKYNYEKRIAIGKGDRSERIRTYNFPQNRITDHRINFTIYKLEKILYDGKINEIIEKLILKFKN